MHVCDSSFWFCRQTTIIPRHQTLHKLSARGNKTLTTTFDWPYKIMPVLETNNAPHNNVSCQSNMGFCDETLFGFYAQNFVRKRRAKKSIYCFVWTGMRSAWLEVVAMHKIGEKKEQDCFRKMLGQAWSFTYNRKFFMEPLIKKSDTIIYRQYTENHYVNILSCHACNNRQIFVESCARGKPAAF